MCQHFGFIGFGVDRSSARRSGGVGIEIFAEIDELRRLPGSIGSFHALTLFEVMEHLDDPLHVLKELRDFLMPEGLLILETPDCTGVQNISSVSDYRKIHPLDHINAFTHRTLSSMVERAGFRAVNAGSAHVTTQSSRVIKNEIRMVGRILSRSTRQYFIKT